MSLQGKLAHGCATFKACDDPNGPNHAKHQFDFLSRR